MIGINRTRALAGVLVVLALAIVVNRGAPARAADVITVSPSAVPAYNADAPDPDVVFTGNAYFAYTTGSWWGFDIGILTSSDPQTGWHPLPGKANSSAFPTASARHPPAAWQVDGTQNAPGVFFWNHHWIMYYSAQNHATGGRCLSIATASSPAGPFVDRTGTKPWLCDDADGGLTDPSPFIDVDGRAWLYFKTNTGAVVAPARIWAVPLDAAGAHFAGLPKSILTQLTGTYPWETTVENPQMIVRGGEHYLLFSGNQWDAPTYAEGYAFCRSAMGPCSQPLPTPFLTQYGSVLGPGGATAFTDRAGRWWLAYHAWSAPCTSYSCGGARKLYVDPLRFAGLQIPCPAPAQLGGYRFAASDGGIFTFGLPFCGSTAGINLQRRIVGMARTPDNGGYWLVASDGAIYWFGDAHFYGSTGGLVAQPIVGMAATPSGKGYWLVSSDGGIFDYGDARFFGSTGGLRLNQPIVGMAAAPDGKGYWLVATDGGIFSFGSARFHGSTGSIHLAQPIVGMTATPDGRGYRFVAADGGIFSFGSAHFYGSTGSLHLAQPIVGMAAAPDARGYWLVARDGGIFSFGSARFHGSTGAIHLQRPIVAMG